MTRHGFAFALRGLILTAGLLPGHPVAAEPRFAGLRLPDHTTLVAAALAQGVQIYESRPAQAGGFLRMRLIFSHALSRAMTRFVTTFE